MPVENAKLTKIGIVVLAAGGSSRLGRPKQLLTYKGETFLKHSVQAATESSASEIVVVLGSSSEAVKKEIAGINLHIAQNSQWQEGMASSIRCGLQTLMEVDKSTEAMILMVCDQPFVNAAVINDLIAAHQATNKAIVACSYQDTFGPPVLFHKSLFEELLKLKGDVGARSILRQHANDVELIPFPRGTFDVDTEEDYQRITAE